MRHYLRGRGALSVALSCPQRQRSLEDKSSFKSGRLKVCLKRTKMHCLSRNPRSCLVNSYSDFKEKNEQRREGYEATWLDVVMETRPEQKYVNVVK